MARPGCCTKNDHPEVPRWRENSEIVPALTHMIVPNCATCCEFCGYTPKCSHAGAGAPLRKHLKVVHKDLNITVKPGKLGHSLPVIPLDIIKISDTSDEDVKPPLKRIKRARS